MYQCIELIDWRGHLNQKNVIKYIDDQDEIAEFLAENPNDARPVSIRISKIPAGYLGEVTHRGEKYLYWDCEATHGDTFAIIKLYLQEYAFAPKFPGQTLIDLQTLDTPDETEFGAARKPAITTINEQSGILKLTNEKTSSAS